MIAELIENEPGEHFPGSVRRQTDVRSVKVMLATGPDGETYPRVGISTPGGYSSIALREGGPETLELFADLEHEARGSASCGADETWIKTTIPQEHSTALFSLGAYAPSGIETKGDGIREAIELYLTDHVDLEQLPEEHRPDGIRVPARDDSDTETITEDN